jgi:HEAT repeat protein
MKFSSSLVIGKSLRWLAASAAIAALAGVASAQQPNFANAKVESRAISGTLDATISSISSSESSASWVAYGVPMIPARDGEHREMCCWSHYDNDSSNNCTCDLENHSNEGINMREDDRGANGGTVKLEGPETMFVLLRISDHHIEKVRTFSEDCRMDAGGLRVIWLGEIKPDDSVAMLAKIVTGGDWEDHDSRRSGDGALTAIAMTDGPAADKAMESFVTADRPEKLRTQTSFWFGSARGKAGVAVLMHMAKNDPSTKVREQVTFGLSVSGDPSALDEMIHMAHDDESSRVRGQALFWLAQKAGKRVAEEIRGAIDNDPDTEVKKKAVFALSQMPKDQGVPMMIEVAKNNKNREVRKQAMFWLGQSNDPRALAFFEEVLTTH